jgi:hypothetical protein
MDLDFEKKLRWFSMEDLKEKWCAKYIGETDEEISEKIKNNKVQIEKNIDMLYNTQDYYTQLNLFHDNGESIVCKQNSLIFMSIFALSVKIFKKDRRAYTSIVNHVKEYILKKKIDIANYLEIEDGNRTSTFQKNAIKKIYEDLLKFYHLYNENRFFNREDIQSKLLLQNNLCSICQKNIENYQDYEGDHILPFRDGGKTEFDNLQVVHKLCHKSKNA